MPRRFQFTLRTLLVVMTIAAVGGGIYTVVHRMIQARREAELEEVRLEFMRARREFETHQHSGKMIPDTLPASVVSQPPSP